jgi:pimeloyl-ACP methyl ester carboxylesterase
MTEMTGSTVRLWHRVSGDGPLLVLIHGITEDHRSFDPLLPLLEQHYRVLAVDLRGHGDSPATERYPLDEMAADVARVVADVLTGGGGATEGGDEATGAAPLVVGHSLGGIVAAAYGARFPVRGVVNIDQSLELAAMQGQVKSIEPMLRSDAFPAVIAGMFGQMAGALPGQEQQRLDSIRRPVPEVVLGIWAPLLELDADTLVSSVDDLVTASDPYPYLQVQGTDAGPDYPTWLRRRIPGAKFDPWPGLGHYPHLCEPERFVALVRAFDPAV